MLFIAMMEAAARAAVSASADSLGANSEKMALVTLRSRLARAQAMNVPARCCSVRLASVASDDKLSFRSLAYSGRAFFRASMLMANLLEKSPHRLLDDEGKKSAAAWGGDSL